MTAASSRCGALTPVALRAPSVSAPQRKTVYHVPGTKRSRCLGIDRHSCRRLALSHIGCGSAALWGGQFCPMPASAGSSCPGLLRCRRFQLHIGEDRRFDRSRRVRADPQTDVHRIF